MFVVEEAALRYQVCEPDTMAAQFGRALAGAVAARVLPHVRRPARLRRMVSARGRITQPSEVSLYLRAFEELRGMAVYGADARAPVPRAIDALR
ncbi:hypothetical protein [Streptomyces sp. NPDC004250]|uniref:hypothetical protein n=1 Tax=Streptomyces sp. NPDC004250 TaxID=3364692 RepID=UPI0036A5A513